MIPGLDSAGSERAKIELYLGHGARRSLKYTEALQHYQKALDIFIYLKDSTNIAACYGAIGNIFDAREQQDKALIYFRESAKILTQLGRRYELTVVLLNMTDNYRYLNMLDSAEITCRQALSHCD